MTRRRWVMLVAGLVVLQAASLGLAYLWKPPYAATVLVGDSITYGFPWTSVGDCEIAKESLPGISAVQIAEQLPVLSAGRAPRYEILLAGMNDAAPDLTPEQVAAFDASYQQIIDSARSAGTTILLASIPPIEPGKSLSKIHSQESIDLLNGIIASKARAQDLLRVDLTTPFMDADGGGRRGYSTDGIHPTPDSYEVIRDRYTAALRFAVAGGKIPCGDDASR